MSGDKRIEHESNLVPIQYTVHSSRATGRMSSFETLYVKQVHFSKNFTEAFCSFEL
jgi:hypothetical protein